MALLVTLALYGILLFALYWVIRKAVAAGIRDARETQTGDTSWCKRARENGGRH